MAEQIEVRKISYVVPVNVDEDGTPLWLGERMVEVRPGEWMTPEAAAFLRLAEGLDDALARAF